MFNRQKLLRLQWAMTYATQSGDSKRKNDGTVNIVSRKYTEKMYNF